jgi:hypothetical protein
VLVASDDVTGDGRLDVRTGPGFGLPADVLSFGDAGAPLGVNFPASANFLGGATVAGARY